MSTVRQLRDDIPTDVAWQEGRRIYIRCGYHSQLNSELVAMDAHWDTEKRARWVGTTKKPTVLPLIERHQERIAHITRVKEAGLWVEMPRDAEELRQRVKQLGGIWGGRDHAQWWAMPTQESYEQAQQAAQEVREARKRKCDQEKAAARQAEQEAREAARAEEEVRKERARARQQERARRVVEDAGRTPTGQTETYTLVSTRRMKREAAQTMTHPVGSVVRLSGGRRGVVTHTRVWFTDGEMASSVCWHPQTHDEAHWDLHHTVTVVEPTEEEQAADETKRAEQADARELHAVMQQCARIRPRRLEHTPIAFEERRAVISHSYGSLMNSHNGGHLIITWDGRVLHQHPGYYDDYIPTEVTVQDPALVARVTALVEQGSRTRTHEAQLLYDYTVTVHERQE